MKKNDKGYKVWTPDGWKDFSGIANMGEKRIYRLNFNNEKYLECSEGHALFDINGEKIQVKDMCPGMQFMGDDEDYMLLQIIDTGITEDTYDLIEVEGNHRYYTNGVVSSNCAFVTGDTTLISPSKLAVLRQYVRRPKFIDRWGCRWYEEIKPNMAYGVILDPSQGIDQDDACIQVWEIPKLRQVAEWNSNQVDQPEQTRMLKRTLKRIFALQNNNPMHNGDVNIYYSIERNGLGIGILNLVELEEESFPGWLVDATATTINVRGSKGGLDAVNFYRGLLTSVSTKKRFCLEFKSLVERNLFIPRSQWLISQMKTFVKKGQSWEAKEGAKDDIVMSAVLMCHLIEEVRFHEPDLDDLMGIDIAEHDPNDVFDPDNMAMAPIVG